jgi:hypothetical protein
MTDPTRGDLQAASGGRRNIPLVASLEKLDEVWLPGVNLQDWKTVRHLRAASINLDGVSGSMSTGTGSVTPGPYSRGESMIDQLMAAQHMTIINDQGDRYTVADWRGCVRVAMIDLEPWGVVSVPSQQGKGRT